MQIELEFFLPANIFGSWTVFSEWAIVLETGHMYPGVYLGYVWTESIYLGPFSWLVPVHYF